MKEETLSDIDGSSVQWRPEIKLLDNRQWSYIKKRYNMTPREIQIARLICTGMSNDEVAMRLTITQGTVKVHIRNIYRKMWVKNKILMLLRFLEDVGATVGSEVVFSHERQQSSSGKK